MFEQGLSACSCRKSVKKVSKPLKTYIHFLVYF
nr:MAG TPA: hypothetical protein [Bacteriophage sp.]